MHSEVTQLLLNSEEEIKNCIKECEYVILYYMDKVEIKCVTNMQDIDIEKLLELRAFNETQEVYLIRAEGEFVGRIRNDSEGHNTKVFDEYHRLWGKVPREETTNILKEDRGIEIHLPFDVKKGEYIFIKVRNYFTTERDLSCVDWRFTGFKRLVKEYVIKESSYPAEHLKIKEEK